MTKQLINPAELFDGAAFGMSQAVLESTSGLVFVSGQVDWDHQYQTSADTVEGQAEKALRNLGVALEAAGATVEGLLQLRIYVRGECGEHLNAVAPLVAKFLDGSRPAITLIGVASLASPETLIEIEAVAKQS
ncbi:MAG: RidA family protein [Myxococcota bacterium]|nr:RidA family protein [Myxococcota bacterium]